MIRLFLAGLLLALAGSASQAEEPQKKSSWLKSLGKTMMEDKNPEEETPSPVVGTRGWSDSSTSSSVEKPKTGTDDKTCGDGKPACEDVSISTTSKKKR